MKRYNPKEIESKWQKTWEESGIYQATEDPGKPKKYILEYFPYPSGAAMHVGHVRNYTIGDVLARFNRMAGYNVLHPMGWDGFGLPAENYAIKTGISPRQAIDQNTARFKEQLTQMGFSYDWSREIDSTDPRYYRWTQWFFLLLYNRGLAYQQESLQWWCPFDKTVLANEQVEAGRCWRCGHEVEKKSLKQWFFKITDYADRLAADLDTVDWSDSIKSMQRNWIGRSTGAEIDFQLAGHDDIVTVFTTRPDTLYGATFMVLSPEHPLVSTITTADHKQHVTTYVKAAQAKSDIERQETNREKTGVFTGAYAINPINDEKIPVWVADYVLMGYGTGAIMAVPAHDERDHAFAEKFNLQIVPVVAEDFGDSHENEKSVQGAVVIGYDKQTKKFLGLRNAVGSVWLVGGNRDNDEEYTATAHRELEEETGYAANELIQIGDPVFSHYYNEKKDSYRWSFAYAYLAVIDSSMQGDHHRESHEDFEPEWFDFPALDKEIRKTGGGVEHWLAMLERAQTVVNSNFESYTECFHDEGVLFNSMSYNGLSSSQAREKIVTDLEEKGLGRQRVNYKMRDWLISRQRYWGAPIPMIHCEKDGVVPVPEDQLPVVLPELENIEPSGDGRSPLANDAEWVNTTCPICGGPAQRETDTMDGFACSSWYFLRFADPHNDEQPFDPEKVKFWLPVDDYIGGAEHAVMHLLYARMWTKVMHDAGLINFDEPFSKLRNHGMILAPDGQKMSKSKGNTIEPGVLIDQGYGADAIRIMELFIGPWNQAANWSVEGMGGAYRFLQRIWTLVQEYRTAHTAGNVESIIDTDSHELLRAINLTTKKVTEDIENMSFNTAIASLMGLTNDLFRIKTIDKYQASEWGQVLGTVTQLLAPFAPHIAEELWGQLGHDTSVHVSSWPSYDEAYFVDEMMTIAVQINGKLRGEIKIVSDADEPSVISAARTDEKVSHYLKDKPIRKQIYVPGRLINFVV